MCCLFHSHLRPDPDNQDGAAMFLRKARQLQGDFLGNLGVADGGEAAALVKEQVRRGVKSLHDFWYSLWLSVEGVLQWERLQLGVGSLLELLL